MRLQGRMYTRIAILIAVAGLFGLVVQHQSQQTAFAKQQDAVMIANGEHILTIYDDGIMRTVITRATSVKAALEAADVTVDATKDVVEPALDTELVAMKYNVNIYRARPVIIEDGGVRRQVVTAQQTPELIAKAAGITTYPEDAYDLGVSDDVLIDGPSLTLTIQRAVPVSLQLYGKKMQLRTQAKTVAGLLKEYGITLNNDDTSTVPMNTPIRPDLAITIWREGKQMVAVDEEIPFPVEKIQDANHEVGWREVKTAGENGTRTVTYELDMQRGQEKSRTEISSVVTKEPKKQVEVVGIKAKAPPYTGGGNKDEWLAASSIPREYWGYVDHIVRRESGWNPNATNPSSGACGLAQALPCGKVGGKGGYDPVSSLQWMNGYVNRYGGWEGAYNFWQSHGWY